jgi:hypothetical protein
MQSISGTFTIHFDSALAIDPTPPPNGVVNQSYTYKFKATGGVGQLIWAFQTGTTPPAGFTLAADGTLSGISAVPDISVSVTVHDTGTP